MFTESTKGSVKSFRQMRFWPGSCVDTSGEAVLVVYRHHVGALSRDQASSCLEGMVESEDS